MISATLPLLGAWALAVVSPGPDFAATVKTAAAHTRRAGLLVATGIVTGIASWAVLAMLGLSALLDRYEHLFVVVRALGAGFLVFYGLRTVWTAWRRPVQAAAETTGPERGRPALGHWRLGLITNLANPKAVVFFGALFAGLLPAGATAPERTALLAIMLSMALAWFALVAMAASTTLIATAYRRAHRAIDTVVGTVFTAAGTALMPRSLP